MLVGNQSAELVSKLFKVVQVVDTQTGPRSLGRVGRADSLAGSSNAISGQTIILKIIILKKMSHGEKIIFQTDRVLRLFLHGESGMPAKASQDNTKTRQNKTICLPATSKLELLESINDLVDIKNQVGTVRDKEAPSAVQSYVI